MDRGDGKRSVLTLRYAIITFSPANIAQQSTRAEVRVERCLTVQALDHWKLKFAQLDQPPQPWVFWARARHWYAVLETAGQKVWAFVAVEYV